MRSKIYDPNSHARIVNYRRTAIKHQHGVNSLKMQKEAYEKDRKRYGWVTVASIEDIGSGVSLNREGFKKVMRLIKNKEVDGVYVTSPDRLSRPLHDLDKIYDDFITNNVKLVTPARVYDLNREGDLLSFDIQRLLAKYNRRCILEKIKKCKQEAKVCRCNKKKRRKDDK